MSTRKVKNINADREKNPKFYEDCRNREKQGVDSQSKTIIVVRFKI
jgi:hypothetical protein